MGQDTLAVIHCEPRIPWQPKRAAFFAEGLRRRGIKVVLTDNRSRLGVGFPILLGTTCWRGIERDGGEFLLVDRCSFGDTERFVSLVWNGHGRRGNHGARFSTACERCGARLDGGTYCGAGCPSVFDDVDASRWEQHGVKLKATVPGPSLRTVLCGQTETYSPQYASLEAWYRSVPWATHFRSHPAGTNPTRLPNAGVFQPTDIAVTLNSSIGVQCVLDGLPTVVMDEGSMAYDAGVRDSVEADFMPPREPWAHWLAWTQWTDDEINEGLPWDYLL